MRQSTASTLAFLSRAVLEGKKAEADKAAKEKVKEERRKRQRRQALEQQEFLALLNIPAAHRSTQQAARLNDLMELDEAEAAAASSSSQPGRRKRKKKRKKKLPKTSSLKSGDFLFELFLVRLLWQCHEFGGVGLRF